MKPEVFLNSLVNYEKVSGYDYDLEAYRKFLSKIGSPHEKLRNVILIGGTKGKGSTAAIISSCLIAHGYKVGLYTSPHLGRINERIKVNNREILNQDMQKHIMMIKPHINMRGHVGARSFFEVLTAIAFLHFAGNDLDFTILEVGLGGRLDATNVVDPLVSVITRIGYDHMNLLGSKLSEIAYEKAGIIRKHSHTITIHQRPSVEKILKRIAGQRGNRLIFAESFHRAIIEEMSLKGSRVRISGELGSFRTFLPLVGKHQVENLQVALAVLAELNKNGFKFEPRKVKSGIEKTVLRGRFEVISRIPLTIYDCAHNEDSFRALGDNIREVFWSRAFRLVRDGAKAPTPGIHGAETPNPKGGFYIIFGCSQDKDISYALKHIFPLANEVLLVKADHPRAWEPLEIFNEAKKYKKNLIIAGSIKRALGYLNEKGDRDITVIIFGSFYLYAETGKSLRYK